MRDIKRVVDFIPIRCDIDRFCNAHLEQNDDKMKEFIYPILIKHQDYVSAINNYIKWRCPKYMGLVEKLMILL